MTENNQPVPQQPQYIYVQPPNYEDEEEIDLLDLFGAVWKKKWFIFFITFLCGCLALAYAFWLPFIYKAESRIMPASTGSGSGGRLAGLVQQYGGLASMMGISIPSGAGGDGSVMIDIMKSNSVVDAIIDKFNLMEELEQEYRIFAREAVLGNLEVETDTKGSGIITVAYSDEDPQKAADIVNSFVEELQKKMQEISFSTAKQNRAFIERQFAETQQELTDAEEAMMRYQQASGVVAMTEQYKTLFDAIKDLSTQIAAKNVEVSSLKSYTRADNPRLKLAQSQLAAMEKELERLEAEQLRIDPQSRVRTRSGDVRMSAADIPELSLEYQRYARALKVATAKYEIMYSQYESARMNEASDLSTIVV
ncbi:MAG: hypothetical protein IJR94_03245, partial [Synergistaceae bacterium]|nr:hypothetical protein [Synergistaceae bacterium]